MQVKSLRKRQDGRQNDCKNNVSSDRQHSKRPPLAERIECVSIFLALEDDVEVIFTVNCISRGALKPRQRFLQGGLSSRPTDALRRECPTHAPHPQAA